MANTGIVPLQIETVQTADLKLPPRTLRRWPKKTVDAYAQVIRECGFVVPLLVDENNLVIDGAALLAAAQKLELAQVLIVRASHLTNEQKRLLTLALHRLPELGVWDKTELTQELQDLTGLGFALEMMGFEIPEFDELLAAQAECAQDPDQDNIIPAAGKISISRFGDVWILGAHRLACGDAREAATYETLMEGEVGSLMITDPPYNVPVSGHVSGLGRVQHREFAMASGEMNEAEFVNFLGTFLRHSIPCLKKGGFAYVFMDWRHLYEALAAARNLDLKLHNLCVWNKTNGGMGSLYRSKHEMVLVLKSGAAPHQNNVELGKRGRHRTNVWDYAGVNTFRAGREAELGAHPTCKPVAMIADAIRDVTKPGELVLDPFCGSGTILIAAEKTGRRARAVEIDPVYVDVAIRRWEAFTGKRAVLAASGETLEAVEDRRQSDASSAVGEV
jgi:DNA modification methylase